LAYSNEIRSAGSCCSAIRRLSNVVGGGGGYVKKSSCRCGGRRRTLILYIYFYQIKMEVDKIAAGHSTNDFSTNIIRLKKLTWLHPSRLSETWIESKKSSFAGWHLKESIETNSYIKKNFQNYMIDLLVQKYCFDCLFDVNIYICYVQSWESSNPGNGRPKLGIPTLDALAIQSWDWTSKAGNPHFGRPK
jgi:hypothetical protein